jgi:hypothetical protein
MEPNNNLSPQSSTFSPVPSDPLQPPQSQRKRLLLLAGGGLAIIIVLLFLIVGHRQKNTSDNRQGAKNAASFNVAGKPYVYACSILTTAGFKTAFNLSGNDTVGSLASSTALPQASDSSETDLTKLFSSSKSSGYASDCTVTVPNNARPGTVISVEMQLRQYADSQSADEYLSSQRRFNTGNGAPLPELPSFGDKSLIILPSALGASQTIKTVTAHKNMVITLSQLMPDGVTAEATVPMLDSLMKDITANADNQSVATKASSLDGHQTMIGKPFIDTCINVGLIDVAKKLGGISLKADDVSSTNQYGALPSSTAERDGVASSCTVSFATPEEKSASPSTTSDYSGTPVNRNYRHKLMLITNRYATAEAAKAALTAKRQRLQASATITDVNDIGEGGYALHKETEIPDFSSDNSAGKRLLTEDAYTLLDGTAMVTLSVQQSKDSKTKPITVTAEHARAVYKQFQTMLAK